MIMRAPALSADEITRIHNDSIRILEEVGVKVTLEEAQDLLEQGGADVDRDTGVVKISRSMVEDALALCPREFTLGARNPEFDVHLPSAAPLLNMDGCGNNTIDFYTGQRRLATLQDVCDAAKVFDHIDSAKILWTSVMQDDTPAGAAAFIGSAHSMLFSGKHLQDEVQRLEELPYILELCKAFAGSDQEVYDRKLYSACYCPVAPLCHDSDMLEGTMGLVRHGGPVLIYPMPAAGTTGPASIYSNVALANAEALSSIVIFQLTSPGIPLIFGAALGRVNSRTGLFLEGAAETELMMVAMTQMGKHYNMPTMAAGCLSDANKPGMQAVMEKTITTLPHVLAGVDVIQGIGLIESSMTLSLEQMIIDEEIYNNCMRIAAGIDVCDEKDLFEDIKAVAQGGHYLKQKSTRKAFRSDEFYNSKLLKGESYDTWVENGSRDLYEFAHEKVAKILAADPVSPVDANTEKVIREIIDEAAHKL